MTNDQIIVIKIGGSVLDQLHPTFYSTCQSLLKNNIFPVVVHGGGKEITQWMQQVGKEPKFIQGRRVTDAESLKIVTSVLGGEINKRFVSTFMQSGVKAIGLSGIDLQLFSVEPIQPELGYVGKVVHVNDQPIAYFLKQGWVPVIASLGVDAKGQIFNVNADDAAVALAQTIGAKKVLMVSDVDGVLDEQGKVLKKITSQQVQTLIDSRTITGGMIPKVRSGLEGLRGSVQEVIILNGTKPWNTKLKNMAGTHLVKKGVHSDVTVSKLSTL